MIVFIDAERGIFRVARTQFDVTFVLMSQIELLDIEFLVDIRHDDVAMCRFEALVDHGNVARMDTETCHRVAIHRSIEGGLGMLDEVAIEVKTLTEVIFSRRREPRFDRRCKLQFAPSIKAGFPSPAEDYLSESLDFNRDLIKHPEATFYATVDGDSMTGFGINPGDIAVIDKSLEPSHGDIVVSYINEEFNSPPSKSVR